MLIKDIIATKDKMNNTAGSFALLGATVPRDSVMAAKLRAAGVIILGKSGMSQWANFRSSNSSDGWSARGGQVLGAFTQNQDPSGSSSGSAVGSSIGLAFASLGTETTGSILSPGEVNNVVGIKPTVGLTSRSLVIPISQHQDTIGPLARTVSDAAHVLSIIAGKDPNDSYTLAQPFNTPPDYTKALKLNALRGKRIGIPRNAIVYSGDANIDKPIKDAFDAAIKVLKLAGATIVDNANFSAWDEYYADATSGAGASLLVMAADFVADLPNQYLSQLTSNPNNVTSLADIWAFTQAYGPEEYPQRDTAVWDATLSLGFDNTSPIFTSLYEQTSYWGEEGGVTGALAAHNLDALIMPTASSPGVPALAGLPVVTVPMGHYPARTKVVTTPPWNLVAVAPNVPFGLSFLGKKWSEETLIGCAYAYEQRTQMGKKVKPVVVPRTQLKDVR